MHNSKIRVIGFDNWTGGSHHYQRLVGAFKKRGIELVLVHLGSWGNDLGRPKTEMLGDLEARDISFYEGKGLPGLIAAENASAVIFLSTDTFAHRAFNRYCRREQVPTINLFHGLMTVQVVDGNPAYKVNVLGQLKFVGARIGKALTKVWPTYVRALWVTGAPLREWLRFVSDILTLAVGKFPLVSAEDARTDKCCVYVASDISFAIRHYGFANDQVVVVGNPDLMQFGLTAELIGLGLRGSTRDKPDVMYVDTGLVFAGRVFSSQADVVDHLVATKEELKTQGKRLVFKPHPDYRKTDIISILARHDIEVCSNEDFVLRLQNCCACIVEPSTAALLPALFGLPLLLAKYGSLDAQQYGKVLMEYPRARLFTDLREFSALLDEEARTLNSAGTLDWIERNVGPMPPEAMPDRVASVVETIANRRSDR